MKIFPRQVILESILLFIIAVVLGFAVNAIHPKGVKITNIRPSLQFAPDTLFAQDLPGVSIDSSGKKDTAQSETQSAEPLMVTTEQVKQLLNSGMGILFDARIKSEYQKSHIAGAQNLPYKNFAEYKTKLNSLPSGKWLICYCDGPTCNQAELLAYELLIEGFDMIAIYHDGLEGWIDAGNSVSGKGDSVNEN